MNDSFVTYKLIQEKISDFRNNDFSDIPEQNRTDLQETGFKLSKSFECIQVPKSSLSKKFFVFNKFTKIDSFVQIKRAFASRMRNMDKEEVIKFICGDDSFYIWKTNIRERDYSKIKSFAYNIYQPTENVNGLIRMPYLSENEIPLRDVTVFHVTMENHNPYTDAYKLVENDVNKRKHSFDALYDFLVNYVAEYTKTFKPLDRANFF